MSTGKIFKLGSSFDTPQGLLDDYSRNRQGWYFYFSWN